MSAPGELGALDDLIDLRDELSKQAPLLARLPHPLPARVINLVPGDPARDLIDDPSARIAASCGSRQ